MSQIRKSAAAGAAGAVYDLGQYRTRTAGAAPAPAEAADQAGISEPARELARAQAAVKSSADVRAKRIEELKQRIADGTYNPDPHEIAKHILERGL